VDGSDPAKPDLERAIGVAARAGRAAWEGVDVALADFAAHVRGSGARADDLEQHGADLYLACASARGDVPALRILERRLLPLVAGPVRRLGVPEAGVDDVLQNVLVAVVAGPQPRIARYSARSALLHWLRVVAIRTAITSLRRTKAPAAGEALLNDIADAGGDPELHATRLRFGGELQQALEESLEKLPRRSKTVLRMHYVDGLNIEAIGAVYRVHRATVARWLIAIRSEVLAGIRERFALSAPATSSDYRSLYFALRDELHVSLGRVLGSRAHLDRI
jgi:RNA polymerase sigma-70 factor (ECF subfamily)